MEKGIVKGYFLEGIQNGVTHHFRMTRRTFFMLQKEPVLQLQTKIGLLGGQYVTDFESAQYLKRIRRIDRRDAKLGVLGCCLAAALGIWLFWFRI